MGRIYSVARNTMIQGLRMKTPLIVLAFLVVVVPALPMLLKSDGTAKGQAQIILTYSLNIASFLICLLTVFVSVAALANDMKEKQIFVLDITPLRRWELLLGKWLGVMVLGSVLLAVMGSVIYVLVKTVVRPSDEREATILRQEVLTARTRVRPEPIDGKALAKQFYEKLKQDGLVDDDTSSERTRLYQIEFFLRRNSNAVLPRLTRYWEFTGLPLPEDPGGTITVRYKLRAAVAQPEGGTVRCEWFLGKRGDKGLVLRDRARTGSPHEFSVPASVIDADGTLDVGLTVFENTSVILDKDRGLEILYKAGSFEVNLLKSLGFMLAKVGFLTALGLTCATFLSFPVASLAALSMFAVAMVSGSAATILGESALIEGVELSSLWSRIVAYWILAMWRGITFIIPDFSGCSGIAAATSGETIRTWDLVRSLGALGLFRAGPLLLAGALILNRRELAGVED